MDEEPKKVESDKEIKETKESQEISEKKPIEEQKRETEVTEMEEMQKESDKKEKVEKTEEKPEIIPENKEGKIGSILKGKNKEGSFKPFIFVMLASLAIAFFWDSIPWIKEGVHTVLDPSAGFLLNWNLTIGMFLIVLIISLITTLVQKYATDQKALKELRKEQKILQEEMKKYREHPEKMAELSKKQMQFIPKTFKLTSRAIMFTGIPFILFFRWFNDFFTALGDPKFFGFLSWFWFYLIATMIFSSILRKLLKVV